MELFVTGCFLVFCESCCLSCDNTFVVNIVVIMVRCCNRHASVAVVNSVCSLRVATAQHLYYSHALCVRHCDPSLAEWPGSGPSGALLLDGIDVVLIVVSVHDASGRVVPDARNNVTFTIAGPGFMLGAGNGDQLNHLPRAGIDYQPAYAGLLKVIVRGVAGTETSTTLQVTAASEGLQSVTIPVVAVAV